MSRGAYAIAVAAVAARAAPALLVAIGRELAGRSYALVYWREELTLSLGAIEIERLRARHDEIALTYRDNAHHVGCAQQRMESVAAARRRRIDALLVDGWPDIRAPAASEPARVYRVDAD